MIIYFSATGNCEYAAKRLARATEDRAVSMTEVESITLGGGERLGFVIPTYFWGLPAYAEQFLSRVEIRNAENAYVYLVASYGTTTGQIDGYVDRLLKKKGLRLSASHAINTVDNWTVMFSVVDRDVLFRTLDSEERQIDEVIAAVKANERVFIDKKKKKSKLMCGGARVCYESARKTKHLHVEKSCIACGQCAENCPEKAIEIRNYVPTWVKDKCSMCFRCLHRCPVFAIQYDDKTQKNGQYVHPKTID